MLALSEHHDVPRFDDRLREAPEVTTELMSQILAETCRRFSTARTGKAARIERLIRSEAWTDAALALIDLELPQWQVRRIVHDGGEWHCALSHHRELPEWLDQSIETHHTDLPLAILSAFAEARLTIVLASRVSVPAVPITANQIYEPLCCDDFA